MYLKDLAKHGRMIPLDVIFGCQLPWQPGINVQSEQEDGSNVQSEQEDLLCPVARQEMRPLSGTQDRNWVRLVTGGTGGFLLKERCFVYLILYTH